MRGKYTHTVLSFGGCALSGEKTRTPTATKGEERVDGMLLLDYFVLVLTASLACSLCVGVDSHGKVRTSKE
jgi:hypothetical protein